MADALRYRLLGPVEVTLGGQSVLTGRPRQRAVLAYLALHANRLVSTDRLVEAVWGGSGPATARTQVQNDLSTLRRVLRTAGHDPIASRASGYLLQSRPDQVDAYDFADRVKSAIAISPVDAFGAVTGFREALALWQGEALAGISAAFVESQRNALDEQRLYAYELLVALELARGEHAAVVAELTDLVHAHPTHETFSRQLVLALYRSGRQAEALEVARSVRRTLVDGLGIDPTPALHELELAVLRNDLDLLAPDPLRFTEVPLPIGTEPIGTQPIGTQPPDVTTATVPRQLPMDIRLFTGRLAEVESVVRSAVRPGKVPGSTAAIWAIDGMAGIGKTALAVHIAHRVAHDFPDGQLFIDLHGYTEGYEPRTPAEALGTLLRGLDVSAHRVPEDVEERAALYRQRLAGTRTLIILDNATSVAQVRPLLPSTAGCLVLVTSRRRLKALDDAHPLPLDPLPETEALALLHAVAKRVGVSTDEPALVELVDLCGRLPLALRIAAAWLRHRPAWTPRDLVELLRDQSQRLATLADGERDLGRVFGLSYASLTAPDQGLFRKLGLMPGPDLDAYATAALAGTDPGTAAQQLERLVDQNLLLQPATGRYRLHDLLRAYARTLPHDLPVGGENDASDDDASDDDASNDDASDDGGNEPFVRLLDYYQHTANRADAIVTSYPRPAPRGPAPVHQPRLPDRHAAWAWLRAERLNLLAALQLAPTHQFTVTLTHGLTTLLINDGPWAEAIALHTTAAAAAEHLGDRAGRAYALFHQADMRLMTCDYEGAMRDIHEALDLCKNVDDHRGQANGLTYLGYLRTMTGDHLGALADLREALRMSREVGERLGEANALLRLARVNMTIGDHPRGLANLREGLGICRELDDQRGTAYALCGIAEIKLTNQDYPGAAQDLHEALRLFIDLGDHNGRGIAHGYLGQLGTLTGDHLDAIHHLETALDAYRQTGARGNEAWALNHYAAAVSATGDEDRGLRLYENALLLSREVQHPDDEAHALEGIGLYRLNRGDIGSATACLERSHDIFQQLAMTSDAHRVRDRLAALSQPTTPFPGGESASGCVPPSRSPDARMTNA